MPGMSVSDTFWSQAYEVVCADHCCVVNIVTMSSIAPQICDLCYLISLSLLFFSLLGA